MPLNLNKKQREQLKALCVKAEIAGVIPPALLKIIYKEKWFKLFVPKKWGGLQLSLSDALKVEEQLAYIDGSLGWTITLCAGANFFAGYIDVTAAEKIFPNINVCLGGSGAATGVAEQTDSGYIVNGFWKYATGAPHLTHFTANCVVCKNGNPVLTKEGTALIRSFFFKKENVTIYNDWNTMGLKATAGRSFSVNNLKVKKENSFVIDGSCAKLKNAIFQYPFLPFAEATTAVNTLGMTLHFLDEALDIVTLRYQQKKLTDKRRLIQETTIAKAKDKLQHLSNSFYESVNTSWVTLIQNKSITTKSAVAIGRISRKLVKECRQMVAAIYPYCGLATTNNGTTINRIFRDIFTASQHGLLI